MFSRFDKTDVFIVGASAAIGAAVALKSERELLNRMQWMVSRILQALSYCFARHGQYKMALGGLTVSVTGELLFGIFKRGKSAKRAQRGKSAKGTLRSVQRSSLGIVLFAGAMNGVATLGKRVIKHIP